MMSIRELMSGQIINFDNYLLIKKIKNIDQIIVVDLFYIESTNIIVNFSFLKSIKIK